MVSPKAFHLFKRNQRSRKSFFGLRLRPRPDDDYGSACEQAMTDNWEPTARAFRRMLKTFVKDK
jgi:hypothetical protein